jgi:hypothetical protein
LAASHFFLLLSFFSFFLFFSLFFLSICSAPTTEGQKQHWIHFYTNSKYDGIGAKADRPNLHLVIALDVSGSMGDVFAGMLIPLFLLT